MEKRIVLIGAGSAQFGYGTIGDILQSEVLAGSHIVLHDINPVTMGVVEETGRKFIEERNLPFSISATTNRAEALKDADYVIISIEVGNRFRSSVREMDTVARLGGDEFAILMPTTDMESMRAVAQKILGTLEKPIMVNNSHSIRK